FQDSKRLATLTRRASRVGLSQGRGFFHLSCVRPRGVIGTPFSFAPTQQAMSQLPALVYRDKQPQTVDSSSPIVRIQKMIFDEAAAADASDVHIEPSEGSTRVRYRVDGVLKESLEIPRWMRENLVVRIKVLARLDISESSVPRDGRTTVEEGAG